MTTLVLHRYKKVRRHDDVYDKGDEPYEYCVKVNKVHSTCNSVYNRIEILEGIKGPVSVSWEETGV